MSKALIIVDTQNDFCENGSLPVRDSNEIFPYINRLKTMSLFSNILITRDWHPPKHVSFANTHNLEPFTSINLQGKIQELWPTHCVQNTFGAQLSPLLQIDNKEIIVSKGILESEDSYSGFGIVDNKSELLMRLRENNIKQVYIVGLAYDYCVGSTALDASKHGFKTFIITEATKSIDPNTTKIMNEKLKKVGVKSISINDL